MAEQTPEIKKKNEQRRMRACKTRLIDKPQRRLHRKPIMKGFVRIKESSSRQREPSWLEAFSYSESAADALSREEDESAAMASL